MASYRLSPAARRDLDSIFYYGIKQFGLEQAIRYRDGLLEHLLAVAGSPLHHPEMKRGGKAFRRSVYVSLGIYYRIEAEGILIVRLLGQQDVAKALRGK